ncbi:MAG: glycosyltransferase [Bacteroidetes bacterium]|nr:glycosyltransferase [Bacteroidota bacterium]
MKTIAVIVTCNRLALIPKALKSVSKLTRKPYNVYVVSNSTNENYLKEKEICKEFGVELFKNYRSENYAGALNTAVEQIVKQHEISEDLYFASFDCTNDFGQNHVKNNAIKLTTLLKSGAFNEGFSVTTEPTEKKEISIFTNNISFENKGNYQFVIGFIAGNDIIAKRIVEQIIEKVPTDLILIIDDTPKGKTLDETERILKESKKSFKIVSYDNWQAKLLIGYYGEYFEKFDDINSIPLGRTILHRHLFDETTQFEKPVYWIIDDDIDLNAISTSEKSFKLFDLINEHINKTDAIIGGISNDPPIPALSCIRTQLVDFLHSYGNDINSDFHDIHKKPDYYYDLSDLHSDHLETPILKAGINESHLHHIFSGKAVFRPALQRELKSEHKTITRLGANTIVLNRDILRLYPVINLEVNDKFARRGYLTWALFNQVVSNKKIVVETFCINHTRTLSKFNTDRELHKSAYDIIGYAFNKAIFQVIENIKKSENPDVFAELLTERNSKELQQIYIFYLQRRKIRFLMHYYRIVGLTKIIYEKFGFGLEYYEQFKDETKISLFENIMVNAVLDKHLKKFLKELKLIVEETKNLTSK